MVRTNFSLTRIAILTALVAVLAGCGDFGSFTFTEESEEIEVDGQGITGDLGLLEFDIPMDINLQQQLQRQDASGARSVHLIGLRFEMTENTDEETFDFLNEIEIYADADGQSRQLLADRDPVPEGQEQFELEVNDELDLKPYAEAGIELETEANASQPSDDARFKVFAEFRVHVL